MDPKFPILSNQESILMTIYRLSWNYIMQKFLRVSSVLAFILIQVQASMASLDFENFSNFKQQCSVCATFRGRAAYQESSQSDISWSWLSHYQDHTGTERGRKQHVCIYDALDYTCTTWERLMFTAYQPIHGLFWSANTIHQRHESQRDEVPVSYRQGVRIGVDRTILLRSYDAYGNTKPSVLTGDPHLRLLIQAESSLRRWLLGCQTCVWGTVLTFLDFGLSLKECRDPYNSSKWLCS